ncbi:MAG: isoprenylcysteine carboxylmethyltransferase family protein [Candidatus Koribacter versatilis]|uniref:Isoprenylcysteine carboxylmethyltransferase family protein n=1 Tax=Candidatus Korobacter versatilis TaxID=658062 RepID=A0A932A7M7_9BACT|nr:isoprenylcysteine carboxylmethyltransferase family protein [Candidatus Koribacter versatilis]
MKLDWGRVARRIRIPLGFAFAGVYFWFARPAWRSLAIGAVVVLLGLWLRAFASGYVKKAAELTTTGPYAYTRNPLYLGSMIMAAGFGVAARNWWLGAGMVAVFLLIYLPVIRFEEELLRGLFPADFDAYFARVPRLLPRLRAEKSDAPGEFSRALYLKHREYQAAIGAAVMFAALAAKMVWWGTI